MKDKYGVELSVGDIVIVCDNYVFERGVVEDLGKDKDGNDIFGSKWVLKYPETVVPITHTGKDDNDTTPAPQPDPQQEEVVEEQTQETNELDDEKITF